MQILIHKIPEPITEDDVQKLIYQIPTWRAEEARRYKHLTGQYCCAKSWEMLMELDKRFDCTIAQLHKNESGKPYVEGAPEFSISHCKAGIAVVVAETEVGIDIETIDRKISRSLIDYTMNDEEKAYIYEGLEMRDEGFIALWTKKEALLKKRGTGIAGDIKDVLKGATETIETHIEREKGYIWSVCGGDL